MGIPAEAVAAVAMAKAAEEEWVRVGVVRPRPSPVANRGTTGPPVRRVPAVGRTGHSSSSRPVVKWWLPPLLSEGCGVGGLVSTRNLLVGPTGHNSSRVVVKVRVLPPGRRLKGIEAVVMAVEVELWECGVGDLVFTLKLLLKPSLELFLDIFLLCSLCFVLFHFAAQFSYIESLQISEKKPPQAVSETKGNRIEPVNRPAKGGTDAVRKVGLLANHFLVSFQPEDTILHYQMDIEPQMSRAPQPTKNFIPKMDHPLILNKLFSDDPAQLPDHKTAYDGKRFIFRKVPLPIGQFGEEGRENLRSPIFTITLVSELSYANLEGYIIGNHRDDCRDILQGMDLVMKENPSSHRISIGRSFYSKQFRQSDDLKCGVAAFRGFQQSLKPTSQGVALCLDHEAMPFYKQMSVIEFLKEHVWGFREVKDVLRLKRDVENTLIGLKVNVTHRDTKQKFQIVGLSERKTRDISFPLQNLEHKGPPREVGLLEYFLEKYNKTVLFKDIPSLDFGKGNYVPMEFCTLVEGTQRRSCPGMKAGC